MIPGNPGQARPLDSSSSLMAQRLRELDELAYDGHLFMKRLRALTSPLTPSSPQPPSPQSHPKNCQAGCREKKSVVQRKRRGPELAVLTICLAPSIRFVWSDFSLPSTHVARLCCRSRLFYRRGSLPAGRYAVLHVSGDVQQPAVWLPFGRVEPWNRPLRAALPRCAVSIKRRRSTSVAGTT